MGTLDIQRWELCADLTPSAGLFVPLIFYPFIVSENANSHVYSGAVYSNLRLRFPNNYGANILCRFSHFAEVEPRTIPTLNFLARMEIFTVIYTGDSPDQWKYVDKKEQNGLGHGHFSTLNIEGAYEPYPHFTFYGVESLLRGIMNMPRYSPCMDAKCGAYWLVQIIGYANSARADVNLAKDRTFTPESQ